ncbi:uncharacterized protein PHACADRAFT_107488, partial [Phanerochaete carnosa HHB-10118-sp]
MPSGPQQAPAPGNNPSANHPPAPTPAASNPVTQSTNTSTTVVGGGVVALPLPGQRGAPRKFKGKHSDVLPFLRFYGLLCDKHNVTSDRDKVESILHYCSRSVRKFMEGLRSYQRRDWNDFVSDVKRFYEADKDQERFMVRDLEKLARHSRVKSIKTMAAWVKYCRDFIRIAGWLKQKGRLSDYDHDYYFWVGIPDMFRNSVESRLLAQNPQHDLANPFKVDDVCKVAEALLHRHRFDRDRLLSEPESENSASETTTDSSDSEDEDDWSDEDYVRRKNFERETPPHLSGDAFPPRGPCWGCGSTGHNLSRCQQLQDYINQGVVKKDERNRFVLSNGTTLFRNQDETWIAAIKRATAPQTNLITIPPTPIPVAPRPVPIEVKPAAFDPADDDAIMEDATVPPADQRRKKQTGRPMEHAGNEEPAQKRPRRSEIQEHVNPKTMLDRVLNAPITVAVGELLAVSREMTQQVQEVIRPKNEFAAACMAATAFPCRQKGQLIRLRLECDGIPITAIVDTGSQLNIAHRKVWQGAVGRPMDVTRKIVMGDANGGEGILQGFRIDGTYLLFKDNTLTVRYEMLVAPEHD